MSAECRNYRIAFFCVTFPLKTFLVKDILWKRFQAIVCAEIQLSDFSFKTVFGKK